MKQKLLLILLLIPAILFAQGEDSDGYYFLPKSVFKKGDEVHLFGDNVKLRQEPNTNCEVVDMLPIGAKVKIIGKTNSFLTLGKEKTPWYYIEIDGNKGYVAGAFFANYTAEYKDNQFYFSSKIHGDPSSMSSKKEMLIRVKEKGSTDYLEYSIEVEGQNFRPNVYNNKGLTGIENVISIEYTMEEYYYDYTVFIAFTGSKFFTIYKCTSGGDEGYYFVDELTFPNDRNGQAGKILYSYKDIDPEVNPNVLEKHEYFRDVKWENSSYPWEGKTLIIKK
ncbi:SH3 domain-containing protein [Aureivirga sp. CE67]|uniref:SH3 domain-containing protein n=1 Tax=Aureivirga sp. CE67 TaxID=1788983 RepID=UPI0018CB6155|nr:SH3 domain-containing protein [Aureivirga sp. CE67]